MHKITTDLKFCFHAISPSGELLNATQIYFGCTDEEAMGYFAAYKKGIEKEYPGHMATWARKDYEGDLLRAEEKITELQTWLSESEEEDWLRKGLRKNISSLNIAPWALLPSPRQSHATANASTRLIWHMRRRVAGLLHYWRRELSAREKNPVNWIKILIQSVILRARLLR